MWEKLFGYRVLCNSVHDQLQNKWIDFFSANLFSNLKCVQLTSCQGIKIIGVNFHGYHRYHEKNETWRSWKWHLFIFNFFNFRLLGFSIFFLSMQRLKAFIWGSFFSEMDGFFGILKKTSFHLKLGKMQVKCR